MPPRIRTLYCCPWPPTSDAKTSSREIKIYSLLIIVKLVHDLNPLLLLRSHQVLKKENLPLKEITMPVTELAFLTLTSTPRRQDGASTTTITPEFEAATAEALRVQDAWCAANLPGAAHGGGREARGAALFQQVEDPAVVLLTAHWASVAEHGVWIASEENQRVFGALGAHIDFDKVRFFHVAGVEAFSSSSSDTSGAATTTPVLQSPVVGIARCFVAGDKKAEFERVYGDLKGIRDALARPHVHRGGWRIEKEEGREGVEEYVVIGGWDSVEAAEEFSKQEGSARYYEAITSVILGSESRHYKRVL
ncbi:hypothetical protein SLS62_002113 [Diatrype stigma]|uniref:ABM domain-containing protein n=1 Tax=Diatrype stigma TaxID=117547 RepID=A0AAN9V968_9PEZI